MDTEDVCRMCLDIDVLMFSISGTPLQTVYEKLTNKPLETGTKPVTACYVCYAQLIRTYRFMLTCCRAEDVIMEILQENPKVTLKSVALLDRKSKGLQASLIVTPMMIESLPGTQLPNTSPYAQVLNLTTSNATPVDYPTVPTDVPIQYDLILELNPQTEPANSDLPMVKQSCLKDEPIINDMPYLNLQVINEEMHINDENMETRNEKIDIKYKPDVKDEPYVHSAVPDVNMEKGGVKASENKLDLGDSSSVIQTGNNTNNTGAKIIYECNICRKRFNGAAEFKVHLTTHTEKTNEYVVCGGSSDIQSRYISSTGEKIYEDVCQKRFTGASNFKDLMTHNAEKPEECGVTGYRETGEKPHKCGICERSFSSKISLKKHLAIHTGEKHYECNKCDRQFVSKKCFQKHMAKHSSEKRYQCTICDQQFAKETCLQKHLENHSHHGCSICNKKLIKKKYLEKHFNVITNDGTQVSQFKCNSCGRMLSPNFIRKNDIISNELINKGGYRYHVIKIKKNKLKGVKEHPDGTKFFSITLDQCQSKENGKK